MTQPEFIEQLRQTFTDCLVIAEAKNKDYAGITDPFKNFNNSLTVGVSPERAILVRIMDKISRISTLLDAKENVSDEKIKDTMLDAINYLAILKVLYASNQSSD